MLFAHARVAGRRGPGWQWLAGLVAAVLLATAGSPARALPLFNRQTGQNCAACHAGGQFPELTPYGRLFKMTGYTIGERTTVPLAMMAEGSWSSVRNTTKDPSAASDFAKNQDPVLSTVSVFGGGRITDNIGAFIQYTYDRYANQNENGNYKGHAAADNMDIRYADHLIGDRHDLIWGVTANNNPSVSDPWNTAAAWMQYVPAPSVGNTFIDGLVGYPGYGVGESTSGLTAYAFIDQMLYVEGGAYRTTHGLFSFMKLGYATTDLTRLDGNAPYLRVALNRQWGASSLMVGASLMHAAIYDDPTATSDPGTVSHVRDTTLEMQYQWLLDPHAFTAQLAVGRQLQNLSPATIASGSVTDAAGNPLSSVASAVARAKLEYTWQSRYGGSLSWFNLGGTAGPAAPGPTFGTANGALSTRGQTLEAYWLPVQNVRVGAQYTLYQRFNGGASNYDGAGRNASDNNTLYLYTWLAY